jgi:hypothetical protein
MRRSVDVIDFVTTILYLFLVSTMVLLKNTHRTDEFEVFPWLMMWWISAPLVFWFGTFGNLKERLPRFIAYTVVLVVWSLGVIVAFHRPLSLGVLNIATFAPLGLLA